jgi:hypothetical protein
LVVLAPAASAVNSDFPYRGPLAPSGDVEADNWRAVKVWEAGALECTPTCPLETYASAWDWQFGPTQGRATDSCSGAFYDGTVSGDGDVLVTAGWTGSGFNSFCSTWEAADAPWSGEICGHAATGEFWIRQQMALVLQYNGSNPQSGVSFGRILGPSAESVDLAGIRFGYPGFVDTEMGGSLDFKHRLDLDVVDDDPDDIYMTGAENEPVGAPAAPCGWPELS